MQTDSWRGLAASVRGTSHQNSGQPCQDAHFWQILPEGILVAAVADGAGSAAHSETGAALAARRAVETALLLGAARHWAGQESDWIECLGQALEAARSAVETEAARMGVPVRELATTLILLVATPECVAAAQVGDGASVILHEDGNLTALTLPDCGEYLNETTFLNSPGALDGPQIKVHFGKASHLALLTDGLQMLALKQLPQGSTPAWSPHAPFFHPLFEFVKNARDTDKAQATLEEFLQSPRVTSRTNDDLSLLLATRVP